MPMVLDAIDKMSVAEKVSTMEYLWNALTAHDATPVPDWHRDILDARRLKMDSGDVEYMTIEESEARLEDECHAR